MAGRNRKNASGRRNSWIFVSMAAIMALTLLVMVISLVSGTAMGRAGMKAYREKIGVLRTAAVTEETERLAGVSPAGSQAGQAVFISICNTEQRADVFAGTGENLESAWDSADRKVRDYLKQNNFVPQWVKADIVYDSEVVDDEELAAQVWRARREFYRYGIAFDVNYQTALLEAELNGAKIYDYDDQGTPIDFEYLNRYLKKSGREQLAQLPEVYTIFQCLGWFCDEENNVYELYHDGLEYGRRQVGLIDKAYAYDLLTSAADFLAAQVKPDGSFVYGIYPRFDNEIDNYNIVRHTSTIWSLICDYRVTGNEELVSLIDSTIDYMIENIVYADENTAYLYEEKSDEIKLGSCGMAVIALTEYMDVFGGNRYTELCEKLGNGILSMFDPESGEYYHVLNGDFSRKEKTRTVYYDGEATFALARLYGLTGNALWLDAAERAAEHFIEADYTQYKDHWVAYSMNEITKYVDDEEYYRFALRNVQENLQEIYERDTTYHTYLEMLMASFEIYERIQERGITFDYLENEFDLDMLLKTIYARADRMLNGYFYPEYAMYMENPSRILNTFMVRHDGYRVRIDDVQHNIGGYYQYYKNYEKLVEYGMLEVR